MQNVNRNLVYDVGMHKGEDTAYYLKKGFDVVAFEADPELIAICKDKYSKEINEDKLIIIEGAIVDKSKVADKTIKFYKNQTLSVLGTVVQEWSIRNDKLGTESTIIEVPTTDFRKCLEEFGIPYYLKIDIEGMDIVCLKSLLHFKSKPNYISIESEKVNFGRLIKEFDLFESLGYDKYQIINQGDITKSKEPTESKEGRTLNYTFKSGSSGLFGSDFQTPWINKKTALWKYRWIFFGYKLWGDNSRIKKWFIMKLIRRIHAKVMKNSIPGWYDTHARHSLIEKTKNNKS